METGNKVSDHHDDDLRQASRDSLEEKLAPQQYVTFIPRQTDQFPASHFGIVLRRQREIAGITERELALRAGVHFRTVAQIERGGLEPNLQIVMRLSRALGVSCQVFAHISEIDNMAS